MEFLKYMPAMHAVDFVLSDDSVHTFAKDIIRRGLNRDCVDAYNDTLLACAVLKKVMDLHLGRG